MAKRKPSTGQLSRKQRPDPDGAGLPEDGPRRFEMPFPATAPRLINPDLGLTTMVGRLGRDAAYSMDVTVLDAPDHRLLRSGVLLAHRVVGERGEWYLAAPRWAPLLPSERAEPMGYGDLPEGLSGLIRPFRRRAPLGPVAALTCERREFEFRDAVGGPLGLLRDDRVTVRRGGVTTARYREVTLTPTGPGLTDQQRAWLTDRLSDAGGTPVDDFPPLVNRLGAPATGLTDFPEVEAPAADLPFGTFVARWLARRLRALVAADLRLSGTDGDPRGPRDVVRGSEAEEQNIAGWPTDPLLAADLVAEAVRLRDEIEALSGVLDTDWISDLDDELDWVIEPGGPAGLRARLRGERYLAVLDQLVNGIRAPKIGELSRLPAADVISTVIDDARAEALAAADELSADSGDDDWDAVAQGLAGYHRALRLAEIGGGVDQSARPSSERRRLDRARDGLAVVEDRVRRAEQLRDQAAAADPAKAFELGRRYERLLAELAADRAEFLRRWAKLIKKVA